jgi:hypothetical protein
MQYKDFGGTFYFNFAINDVTGAGADGSGYTAYVRLKGAGATDAPVYTATPYLLSHASYPSGCMEVAIVASAINGFVIDSEYAVFCTLAVSAINPTGFIGEFITTALASDEDVALAIIANPPSITIADGALTVAKFGTDVKTGNNLNANVVAQNNIDFGALQKTSLGVAALIDSAGVTTLLTRVSAAVALASELAKVPKSDSIVSFNSTALAAVADAVHDEIVEGTLTLRHLGKIFKSILEGNLTIIDNGNGTHTYNFYDILGTTLRASIIVNDTTGNRTIITTNGV